MFVSEVPLAVLAGEAPHPSPIEYLLNKDPGQSHVRTETPGVLGLAFKGGWCLSDSHSACPPIPPLIFLHCRWHTG